MSRTIDEGARLGVGFTLIVSLVSRAGDMQCKGVMGL